MKQIIKRLPMWTILLCYLVLSPVWAFGDDVGNSPETSRKARYVPGELLVKYRPSMRAAASEHYRAAWGISPLRTFKSLGIQQVKLPEDLSVEEALEIYKNDPDVEYVEPNYIRRAFQVPNDPSFNQLWGLQNTGQTVNNTSGTSDADIDAPEAWDITTGSTDVIIAVLDTGVDLDHVDIKDNLWKNPGEDWAVDGSPGNDGVDNDGNGKVDDYYGWDFVNNDNDPEDDNSTGGMYHGTHVSGIIAAKGNNNLGVTGVCWSASIMPLKILDSQGDGTVAAEIAAVNYAISNGATIINASFGGPTETSSESDAITTAKDAGLLYVAAAGNKGDGFQPSGWDDDVAGQAVYPASYDLENIIAVAATDQNDGLAQFSNYGAQSVDVAAPGVNIYSTKSGDGYQFLSGTSMATAYVSGLAGLIQAQNPLWTYTEIKAAIEDGVDVKGSLSGKVVTGGRVNALNSLLLPPDPSGLSATAISASQINLSWSDNSSNETGFKIERKTGAGGTYSQIAAVAAGVTTYSDSNVSESTTYYYRVRAYSAAGNSGYTNEANALTYPGAPSNLSLTSPSSTQINLSWRDNSSGESGFKIERKTGAAGVYTQIAEVAANVVSYSDTGLTLSTTYYYRLRAFNATGDSSYSNEAHVATLSALGSAGGGGGGGGGCFVTTATRGGYPGEAYIGIAGHWGGVALILVLIMGALAGRTIRAQRKAPKR